MEKVENGTIENKELHHQNYNSQGHTQPQSQLVYSPQVHLRVVRGRQSIYDLMGTGANCLATSRVVALSTLSIIRTQIFRSPTIIVFSLFGSLSLLVFP